MHSSITKTKQRKNDIFDLSFTASSTSHHPPSNVIIISISANTSDNDNNRFLDIQRLYPSIHITIPKKPDCRNSVAIYR
jgi:hypothetical protein